MLARLAGRRLKSWRLNTEFCIHNLKCSFSSSFESVKSAAVSEERVVVTDDGSTVVCWHPEKPFPYEFSRPLPEEEFLTTVNTVFKVENKADIYEVFKTKSEEDTREELMQLTHTTKHRWFPNNLRYKKTYKKIKGDREFL